MSHVRTVEQILCQVRIPFRPKHDPCKSLAEEIESCKRKIWECVDPAERKEFLEKKKKTNASDDVKVEFEKENTSSAANVKIDSAVPSKEETNKPIQKVHETKAQAPPSRTDIELKVFVMKVVELKKELKNRGQETGGLKKDLRARLINVMLEESQRQETRQIPAPGKVNLKEELTGSSDTSEDSKMAEHTSHQKADVSPKTNDKKDNNADEQREESVRSMNVEQMIDSTAKDKTNREVKKKGDIQNITETQTTSATKDVSTTCSSAKEVSNKTENTLSAINELVATSSGLNDDVLLTKSDGSNSQLTEMNLKQFSQSQRTTEEKEDTSCSVSEVSFSSKTSGTSVKDMVSKFSGFSSTLPSSNGSSLSKGLQAKKEAREARIAEMRAKAQTKPVSSKKVALTSKEFSNTLSSLNATVSTGNVKKNNLASQMREKAAARAFQKKLANKNPLATAANKRLLPLSNNSNHSNVGELDPMGTTLKQVPIKKASLRPASPMDTYEISDREDSDTDDSDSDSDCEKTKKKIPTWAQRQNLLAALEDQYNGRVDGKRVDPDDIFPEVHSCDLEAIFGKKKKNYRSRASSGNWANDKVTSVEKLVYKRQMGFSTEADVTQI